MLPLAREKGFLKMYSMGRGSPLVVSLVRQNMLHFKNIFTLLLTLQLNNF